jgi:hypothetical protein
MTQKQLKRMKGETAPEPINGSRELKNAVLKAISFNPNERYADAVSMRAALEAAKDGGKDTNAHNDQRIPIASSCQAPRCELGCGGIVDGIVTVHTPELRIYCAVTGQQSILCQ